MIVKNCKTLPRGLSCFDFLGIGSAIGGIAGAFATKHAADKSLQSVRETNKANAELAKQQNDWNIEQWNRENEYNSPSNQLKLLQDAGLNPLMYGQDIAGHSQAGSVQSANLANQVPDTTSPGLYAKAADQFITSQTQALDYYLKSRQLDQEDRRLDQQDAIIGNDTRRTDSDIATAEYNRRYLQGNIDLLEKKGRLTESQIKNMDQQTANLVTAQQKTQAEIQNLGEVLNGQIIANHRSNIAWQIEQATMDAQIKNAFLELGLKRAQIAKIGQEIKNFILDGKRKEFEIDIAGVTASIKRTENASLNYQLFLDKKYGDSERGLNNQLTAANIVNKYISSVCQAVHTGVEIVDKVGSIGSLLSHLNPF